MDAEHKKALKRLGKAEVERRSSQLRAQLAESNPAPAGSDAWARNYRTGTDRERWLRRALPTLNQQRVTELFVVSPITDPGWRPHPGAYVRCNGCGSVAPVIIPRRPFYWGACACGNVKLRAIGPWREAEVRDPSKISPVKLIGRGVEGA